MKVAKKGLAMLLAALMLVSAFPLALAEEEAITEEVPAVEESAVVTSPAEDEEVVINLLDSPFTVGTNGEKAQEEGYFLFEEDGSFVIPLEDNAFYPYEVQFTVDGETTTEWFETPESAVEVGGHTFTTLSQQTDATQLRQAGLWIGEEYVPIRPKAKTFSNEPRADAASLLPLEEKVLDTVDLTGFNPAELRMVRISTLFNGADIDGVQAVAWVKGDDSKPGNDEYQVITADGYIDMRALGNGGSFSFTMIVGTAKQLDPTNIRYTVPVQMTEDLSSTWCNWLTPTLYKEASDGTRTNVPVNYYDYETNYEGNEFGQLWFEVSETNVKDGEAVYLGLDFDENAATSDNFDAVKVYLGTLDEYLDQKAEDITAKIWKQDMTQSKAGYLADYTQWYESDEAVFMVIEVLQGETVVGYEPLFIYETVDTAWWYGYLHGSGSSDTSFIYNADEAIDAGTEIMSYALFSEYPANGTYSFTMEYYSPDSSEDGNELIDLAVVGRFNTREEAQAAIDASEGKLTNINTQLFSTTGYAADYSGAGLVFTFFVKDQTAPHYYGARTVDCGGARFTPYANYLTTADGTKAVYSSSLSTQDGVRSYTQYLYLENPVSGEYLATLYMSNSGSSKVDLAVVGLYSSRTEAEAAIEAGTVTNIRDDLFGDGYKAAYDKTVTFSLFVGSYVYHVSMQVKEGESLMRSFSASLHTEQGVNPTYYTTSKTQSGVYVLTNNLYAEFSAADEYLCALKCTKSSSTVELAVTGHYTTKEAVEAAIADGTVVDIKDELFGDGYKAKFNTPVSFTVVVGGYAYRVKVQAESSEQPLYSICAAYLKTVEGRVATYDTTSSYKNGVEVYEKTLYSDYPADAEYLCALYIDSASGNSEVALAVVGKFKTQEEAQAAIDASEGKLADIKDDLFGSGYRACYGGDGVTFSVFTTDGYACYAKVTATTGTVKVAEVTPPEVRKNLSKDTYFNITGAEGLEDNEFIVVPYDEDSYCYLGYQTVFVLKEDADLSALKPTFSTAKGINIYAGDPATAQKSSETEQDFTQGPVHYSTSSESKTASANYWVTFVQKDTAGAKLFVNGANASPDEGRPNTVRRDVTMNSYLGNYHDIFIANVGGAELTGLEVELKDAKNVKLDEYWTVGGEGNNTLAPLTSEDGGRASMGKIRLVPDGVGEISGTLTIKANGQDPVVFTLHGEAGDPVITTEEIAVAVKYVPYGSMIQNDNKYSWNNCTYSVPDENEKEMLDDLGVSLYDTGELYGVPLETGEFKFTVLMVNTEFDGKDVREFTLTVQENTDENVNNQVDDGYGINVRVKDMAAPSDQRFEIEASMYGESENPDDGFQDLYLNGKKLTLGEDYTAEEGSTKGTIYAQTFKDCGNGTVTLGWEYRNSDNEVKKAAQNVGVGVSTGGSSSASRPTGSAGSVTGGSGNVITDTKNANPESALPQAKDVFKDIENQSWYYASVNWAYRQGLMLGTSQDTFSPFMEITQSMVVAVLARMSQVDLTKYTDVTGTTIKLGNWYTSSAIWAWQAGMLADGFDPDTPITRGKIATMLVKYLDYRAVKYDEPQSKATFADASEMTDVEARAFQILAANNIFKGVGGNAMAPNRTATRVELAALLNRLGTYLKNK